jgi:hypothetical protein
MHPIASPAARRLPLFRLRAEPRPGRAVEAAA